MKNYYQLILLSFACICSSDRLVVGYASSFITSIQHALLSHLTGATFKPFAAQLLIASQLLMIIACLRAQRII